MHGFAPAEVQLESARVSVNATGSWLVEGSGSQSSVEVQASSNDLVAASVALGYRSTIEAKRTELNARLRWPGGPRADAVSLMDGDVDLDLQDGQLRNVEPGAAGRVLGLTVLVELPRRLALDFRDVTDEGLAFDSVRGDFEVRKGNAYTKNLLLSGTVTGHRRGGPHRSREPGLRPDRDRERQSRRASRRCRCARRRAGGGCGGARTRRNSSRDS